jgi:hypothetical protein
MMSAMAEWIAKKNKEYKNANGKNRRKKYKNGKGRGLFAIEDIEKDEYFIGRSCAELPKLKYFMYGIKKSHLFLLYPLCSYVPFFPYDPSL